MSNVWTLIAREADAVPFVDTIVAFQTNMHIYGSGRVEDLVSAWSQTQDENPAARTFFGFVSMSGKPDVAPYLRVLLKADMGHCFRNLKTNALRGQADNPNNANSGKGCFLQMRRAIDEEITATSKAVRNGQAFVEYRDRAFETSLGLR